MQITVVFEHWHLGDGNYPAFSVGDAARLSFEIEATRVELVSDAMTESVRQVRDADYEIVGSVIRNYENVDGSSPFSVLEADWFRFYCTTPAAQLPVGARVHMWGRLALDHYQWVEFLDAYPDPPDLFYGVRVDRIRRVRVPERFIQRSGSSSAYPTALSADAYRREDTRDVKTVGGDDQGPAFSLLDLEVLPSGAGPRRPTFLGPDV